MLGFIVDFDSENLQTRIEKPFDSGPVARRCSNLGSMSFLIRFDCFYESKSTMRASGAPFSAGGGSEGSATRIVK